MAQENLGSTDPDLRPQLGHLKRFLDSFDLARMAPATGIIAAGVPAGATARVLADPGRQYAVYVSGGEHADLRLELPAGRYAVEWVDPRTGSVSRAETLEHGGGAAALRSPAYEGDIALAVRAVAGQ